MPFVSQSQRKLFYAKARRGEMPMSTVKEWEAATPKGKKLPDKKVPTKEAFAAALLTKAAAEGVKTTDELVAYIDRVAAMCKQADSDTLLGKLVGGLAAAPVAGGILGLAGSAGIGYGMGSLTGSAANQMDESDSKALRLAALANAYRRRAAETKTNAQVRQLVASDPSKYVVVA